MSELLPIATLKEAAVRLGVSATYLRHQASPEFELRGFQGPVAVRLGARKIGRDWYVDREALEAEARRRGR